MPQAVLAEVAAALAVAAAELEGDVGRERGDDGPVALLAILALQQQQEVVAADMADKVARA
ncbi:hypothetical protein D0817_25595, partial [Flavobacterium cupreum]